MRCLWLIALLAACSASDDVPSPQLASVSPSHAPSGSVVMVSGSYFCQRPDNGEEDPTCDSVGIVDFGTVPGTTTTWADNAIMVEVPHGNAGDVDLSVSAGGRISNSISFSID
jgi:hypothetical protein